MYVRACPPLGLRGLSCWRRAQVKYDFDVDDNGLFRLVNGPNAPIRKVRAVRSAAAVGCSCRFAERRLETRGDGEHRAKRCFSATASVA